MRAPYFSTRSSVPWPTGAIAKGFTLIELLIVIGVIAILAALLFPLLSQARGRAQGAYCLNNNRQLALAWQLYADDHNGALPYNLVMAGTSLRTNLNWVNNVMTWDLSPDNTNLATITGASLAPFAGGSVSIFHCPADQALSAEQSAAGWSHRIRSYSMNAMMGDVGSFSATGVNLNNPTYRQFFKITEIPQPTEIFVFLEEHPDSINDGYFLNKYTAAPSGVYPAYAAQEWQHLPASYHNRATAFSFADGHASLHRWLSPTTLLPAVPDVADMPLQIPAASANAEGDFYWVLQHMSVLN